MPVMKNNSHTMGKMDGRANGNRANFRTDSAISNSRLGNERVLQPWISDTNDTVDGSLEKSSSAGPWDQFAENERLFGLQTDYDENIYTTAINKDHPQYRERIAAAEKKAREIERSAPVTSHVAEERMMDYVGGKGEENEEDKYSGVHRQQDFPPLSSGRENRYTPPARRAPAGSSTVKSAPVDPAIISSQIRLPKKQAAQPAEQSKPQTPLSESGKNGTPVPPKTDAQKPAEAKLAKQPKSVEAKPAAPVREVKIQEENPSDKVATSNQATPKPANPEGAPSAVISFEHDILNSFKLFATQQRMNAEKVRSSKAKVDKEVKLTELKRFAHTFRLSTPLPRDLVPIIAKDPAKQKEIQAKAMKNAEEMARARSDAQAKKEAGANKDSQQPKQPKQPKQPEQPPSTAAQDARPARAPVGPQATPPNNGPARHTGSRPQFAQQQYHNPQGFRGNRAGPQQHVSSQHPTGNLAQRLRNVEQQKFAQPPLPLPHQHATGPEVRAPPTGPSNSVDAAYARRQSGPFGGAKLNPNSNEFRPSAYAASFNPNSHPSAGSSPRSSVNHVAADSANNSFVHNGQLIRRKTKAVDMNKCFILSHIQTITPPQGRNWDENCGLRPSYDTLPTWRQLQDDEKADSTMHLTYKEHFEKQPFSGPSMPTPNPPHVVAYHNQIPFQLQHGAQNMLHRQSPHMPPMQIHTPQHGHLPQQPYGNDDHRMMHSNSAQSFASPRMGQPHVAYAGVTPPGQVPYSQPVFVGPGNAQIGQFRSFSNNPQYVPPQGQMGQPMMMQPQYLPGPQGMMSAPHMMYHGAHHPQFMPPTGPPQPVPGANGYPSPGRPAAPMMVHQGSQQGHMYGMSPSLQYNQPSYGPGQASGPMSSMRAHHGSGPQQSSTSPQQGHRLYPAPHNNGNHYNKNHLPQNFQPVSQVNHVGPRPMQGRGADSPEEAK